MLKHFLLLVLFLICLEGYSKKITLLDIAKNVTEAVKKKSIDVLNKSIFLTYEEYLQVYKAYEEKSEWLNYWKQGVLSREAFQKNMSITKADLENLFLESPYFPTFNHKKISFFDYSFIIRSGYGQSVPTASITVFIKCDTTIFTLAHLKCYKVNGTWKLVKPEEEMKWSFRPVPALADSILRAWNRSISKSKSDVLPIAKAIEVWNLLNNYDTSAFKKFLLSQKEFEHYIKLNWGKLAISSDDSYKNYLLSALINYKSLCDSTKAHKNLKAQLGENSLSWMVVNQPYDSHNGKNYLTWMHFLIPTMDSNEKFFVSRFMFRKIDKKWKISNNENSFGKASYLRVATPVCELRCTGEYNY